MKLPQFITSMAALALFISITATSCEKEKGNAEESITTVELHDPSGKKYKWEDLEGDGNPTIDTITLRNGTTTKFDLHFYNRSGGTSVEITDEIRKESLDHLVVYVSSLSLLQISTTDKDSAQKPLGLKSDWKTVGMGTGNVRITLKHNPDKSAPDPSVTGATDIEVMFPVRLVP